jgi:hypothetical protein
MSRFTINIEKGPIEYDWRNSSRLLANVVACGWRELSHDQGKSRGTPVPLPVHLLRSVSAGSGNEDLFVRLFFRLRFECKVEVHLYVELGFESRRLADLVQLLAHSEVTIKDLKTDRSMYHLGMPERFVEVTFLVAGPKQKDKVLEKLAAEGFGFRERTVTGGE